MYGWHGAQLLSWNLVKTMDNGYENNALEKVTPRRYDQIWMCSVSVAASYWIQRVNLSFESPHPTATKDKLAAALVHRWNCWHVDILQTEVHMLTHTHMLHHFFLWKFSNCNCLMERMDVPQFLQLPAICSQESRETRLQADSPLSIEIYGLAAWKPGFKRVTFGKPSSPGETTKLTVLQPGGVSFWLRFFCV